MMNTFVAVIVAIGAFIGWNIWRAMKAHIKILEDKQAEGFLDAIAKKAKEEVDKKSFQDVADDLANRYPVESHKHNDDHS